MCNKIIILLFLNIILPLDVSFITINPKRHIKTKSDLNFGNIGNSNILARDSARELGLGPWVSYPTNKWDAGILK